MVAQAEVMILPPSMSGCLAFSPDGTLLAAGDVVIDAADGRVLRVLRGHVAPVTGVAFSPDGTLLATGSFDGTARVWEVATGAVRLVLACHSEGVNDVAFAPDGTVLASAGSDRAVRIWDTAAGAGWVGQIPVEVALARIDGPQPMVMTMSAACT